MKKLVVIITSLLLIGCVTFKTVGIFETSGESLKGTVSSNLVGGGGDFRATSESGVSCSGAAAPPDTKPNGSSCEGQEGGGQALCNDGRSLLMRWKATSCYGGYGEAVMNTGEKVRFVFTNNEFELNSALVKFRDYFQALKTNREQIQSDRPKLRDIDEGNYDRKASSSLKQDDIKGKLPLNFNDAKLKCAAIGFKPKSEKFGNCVLELTR